MAEYNTQIDCRITPSAELASSSSLVHHADSSESSRPGLSANNPGDVDPSEAEEGSALISDSNNAAENAGAIYDYSRFDVSFIRDWLRRAQDSVGGLLVASPGWRHIYLALFDNDDYPNNLDEKHNDGRNFGRYRVVSVRDDEVCSTSLFLLPVSLR